MQPLDLSEIIDDGVLTLDDSNFDKIVAKGDAFVKFFIPGCGFCKNMKPAWHALGNRYLADTRVHIAMVCNTAIHSFLCSSYMGVGKLFLYGCGTEISLTHVGTSHASESEPKSYVFIYWVKKFLHVKYDIATFIMTKNSCTDTVFCCRIFVFLVTRCFPCMLS